MKTKFDRNFSGLPISNSGGMTLLDVLLAIIIFVVGMLALASLQGNLARSSNDAKARTVGTNLAERIIEELRTYDRLESVVTDDDSYENIVSETLQDTFGGVEYTTVVTVDDYYFMPDGITVTDDTDDLPSTQETRISNFKRIHLDVSWTGNEFQLGDGTSTTDRLGSGNFAVTGFVASLASLGSASIAAEDDGIPRIPDVPYTPGDAPDIVKVEVGDNRFRESSTAEPIVRRADELVETWFDVITFNQGANPNVFLRREEFVAISCECEIQSGATALDGREPTLWTGAGFKEGTFKQKTYGVSATQQQSQYCDVCCRDHHDSTSSSTKYRPWMASNDYSDHYTGDHPHYDRNNKGEWIEAEDDGDTYLEACRLVRKDGFFRATQDFNLNEINVFPENYLGIGATEDYSNYVRAVANEELGDYDDAMTDASRPANLALEFDGDEDADGERSPVPQVDSASTTTQLRSRGIYIDTLNSLLVANLEACFGNGDAIDCEAPDATSPYELYPFFDLQLTHLARWFETDLNNPVHISNDAINKNGYSRGLAELDGDEVGTSTGTSKIEVGNVGLISTLPVAPVPTPVYTQGNIYLVAGDGTDSGGSDYPTVTGTFNNEGGTSDAEAATLTADSGVECSMPTNGVLECVFGEDYTGGTATLTITNYSKNNTDLYICTNNDVMTRIGWTLESVHGYNSTVFELPSAPASGVSITITKDACPDP